MTQSNLPSYSLTAGPSYIPVGYIMEGYPLYECAKCLAVTLDPRGHDLWHIAHPMTRRKAPALRQIKLAVTHRKSELVQCWVKNCDGDHDRFMHPVHTCYVPLHSSQAKKRIDAGQEVRGEIRDDLPSEWTCPCGKKWARSKRYWTGWELV